MPLPPRAAPAVMIPLQPESPDDVLPFAEFAVRRRARRLWMGQSLRCDAAQIFAHLAGGGLRVAVGTGVSLMALRTPYDAALQARSLALVTGRPVVAGYGTATPAFVASLHGEPWASARTAAGEFLAAMRALLDGGEADGRGTYHRVRAALPPTGPHAVVEVGAGVLRPAMARTAAASADVAVSWLTPPDYVRDVLVPALTAGADLRTPRVATVVHVAVDRPGRDPARIADSVVAAHLGAGHYVDMLRRAGVPLRATDDPLVKAKQLVESGVFVFGDPPHIARELARYTAAGVDEIVLNTGGVLFTHGEGESLADLEDVFTAVEELHG
ncbi:LLM class flavin-dependent oxidoreductase [Streptomyces sp. NPDC096080]|uniref:LLM class flavin-dependent oxidoreductase n=1 Tax=Streptomyces sp. NPDC096080 TaxID=3156693 RepID=UPI00331B68EB